MSQWIWITRTMMILRSLLLWFKRLLLNLGLLIFLLRAVKLLKSLLHHIGVVFHHVHCHFHHFWILEHLFLLIRNRIKIMIVWHHVFDQVWILFHHIHCHFHVLRIHHLRIKCWYVRHGIGMLILLIRIIFIFFFVNFEIILLVFHL